MPDAQIRVELPSDHPHVLLATIDNPPVNVMNTALYLRMQELFEGIAGDGKVRCIVLTGAGARAFVAGSDVKDFAVLTPGTALARARIIRNAFTAIRECVVPVIGAINGPALGAGMAIAAACDVVLAAENAVFGLPEINVGVLGGAQHLSRVVPPKRMRWMALSGKRLSAQELTAAGGVERVVPADRLIAEALAMADEIAEKSPPAIRLQKECLNLIETLGVDQGYHVEQLGTAILSSLPESKEAASAFVAKRKPKFD
jgi:enoyl-CoA hydratase